MISMPVKRRIEKQRRRQWEEHHRIALASGNRYFDAFGGHGNPWDLDEARAAWSVLGGEIAAEWCKKHPCTRPWGWWVLEMGIEFPGGKSCQRRYLHAHGHLTSEELAMVVADPTLLAERPHGHDM